MATKGKILLPSITGIAPGSPAGTVGTFNLPLNLRYSKIQLVYVDGGSSPTDILSMFDDILIFKGTKVQRTHNAAELDHLNSLNNQLGDTTYSRQQINTGAAMRQSLNIYFAEPWRKDKADTDSGAWNVTKANGFNTFQMTVKLLAAMPSTGSIIAYAWVDAPLPIPAGKTQAIKKVYRQQIPASGLAIDVTTLDQSDAYQVIALKNPTGAYIQQVTLKRNGDLYMDQVVREDNVAHLINLGLNPANSVTAGAFGYDIVLDADDPVNSSLIAQGQALWLHLGFSASASGNAVALIERVGAPD
jgi:hypothetical protein